MGGGAISGRVPAKVCEDCGERYFQAESSYVIEHLLEMQAKPNDMMLVPVYSYEQATE